MYSSESSEIDSEVEEVLEKGVLWVIRDRHWSFRKKVSGWAFKIHFSRKGFI